MKRLCSAVVALVVSGVVGCSAVFAGSVAAADLAAPSTTFVEPATTDGASNRRDFDRFLQRDEAANAAFLNGDPGPWLSMVTEKDPASIFGGFGGLGESGVAEVHQRYLPNSFCRHSGCR